MTNEELTNLKDDIITKSYRELARMDIMIEFKELDDSLLDVGVLEDEGYYIEVDEELIKTTDENELFDVLTGGIAHELSHICKKPRGAANVWLDKMLYKFSWQYRMMDERDTDLHVILRGYGKELLKFMQYSERLYSRYEEDGLSQIELKVLLEKK